MMNYGLRRDAARRGWVSGYVLLGLTVITLLVLFGFARPLSARSPVDLPKVSGPAGALSDLPAYCCTYHNVGRIKLAVSNRGIIGVTAERDCLTGEWMGLPCEFPKGSYQYYHSEMSIWLGGIIGRDTLVSSGTSMWATMNFEMAPDIAPFGDFIVRSLDRDPGEFGDSALSEQDLICTYTDTMVAFAYGQDLDDGFRQHLPMGVEIKQSSYAWSYSYAEDFVLFDLEIRNISDDVWENVYLGLFHHPAAGVHGGPENVVGFRPVAPSALGCGFKDTLNMVWSADNDGDPVTDDIKAGDTSD